MFHCYALRRGDLQESAGALKHLTRVYGNTKSLPDWEGVESIFQDVQDAYAVIVHLFKRSHSPFVHSEIAEMLHHISLLPEGKTALGEVGAIGALVQQCKSPGQQQRCVVMWICTALCVLVMDDENRSHFTEADGPGALLDLMRRVPATSLAADMEWDEVIVGAAHALSNYMAGAGRMVHHYQSKVDEAGGAQELIQRCWGGIGGGGGGGAPTMGAVSSAGGLPSALAGTTSATTPQPTPLSPHAGGARSPMVSPHGAGAGLGGGVVGIKERLVEQCCGALCNLSCENDLMRIKLGELGACGLLTAVCRLCDMQTPSQKRILEQACAAIGNICKRNRSNRCKMSAVYGPETLVQVLGRARLAGPDADAVATQALRAAANVAMRNEENQQRLADAGCCQHLVQYCFAVRDDALLNWVLAALGALAQDEVIKYRLVNEGALAAAAAAENSARSQETKEALKRLAAQLPLPTPVLGSVILKEEDEEVYLEADDDTWVPARSSLLYDRAGAVTSLSARFVQHCRSLGHQIKDVHAANAGDGIDRRKSPPGLTRIRLKVRDRSVTVDADLNSSQEHDILLGPVSNAACRLLPAAICAHGPVTCRAQIAVAYPLLITTSAPPAPPPSAVPAVPPGLAARALKLCFPRW